MESHEVALVYELAPDDDVHDEIVERFGAAGLTDFVLGLGRDGYIRADTCRGGDSAASVLSGAMADIGGVLPTARLFVAGPSAIVDGVRYL